MIFETMKKYMRKALKEFASELGAKCKKKKKVHIWMCVVGDIPDEPIQKTNMEITLKKPIRPGFQRSLELITDAPVDKREDGSYAVGAVVAGDSSAPEILPESTNTSIKTWIKGDGALGDKTGSITVDAHVGTADVPLTANVNYTVAHPDATEFSKVNEGDPSTDVPIPTP